MSVRGLYEGVCEKLTFRVSDGNETLYITHLPTYVTVVTLSTVVTIVTVKIVVTALTVVALVNKKLFSIRKKKYLKNFTKLLFYQTIYTNSLLMKNSLIVTKLRNFYGGTTQKLNYDKT